MDLVILHYHLNRGGVTRVIENHLRALATLDPARRPKRALIAYGGRAADWDRTLDQQLPFPVQLVEIPELDYDELHSTSGRELLAAIRKSLVSFECKSDSTILHAHNHSLGKNAALPHGVAALARDGWRFLLQVHDFAEDLRPDNYGHLMHVAGSRAELHATLYPQAPQIHYATLNPRDHQLFLDAGLPESRLHRVPNPVVGLAASSQSNHEQVQTAAREKLRSLHAVAVDQTYVLYPVRGIRRKNLGEFLLWASLFDSITFATTLPPINPRELRSYESWKQLARELSLPVIFEAGEKLSLDDNYAAADAIMTTSVAEGFGLVFLEASLMRRPLFGRDLPGVTADFRAVGLQFPGLASSMRIPADWIDLNAARQTLLEYTRKLRNDYGFAVSEEDHLGTSVEELFAGEFVDFGRLSSAQQAAVLRRIHQTPDLRKVIQSSNPIVQMMHQLFASAAHQDCDQPAPTQFAESIELNAKVIEQHYSLMTIGDTLGRIYSELLHGKLDVVQSQPEIARTLQLAFLEPRQIHPVRLET